MYLLLLVKAMLLNKSLDGNIYQGLRRTVNYEIIKFY